MLQKKQDNAKKKHVSEKSKKGKLNSAINTR